MTDFFIADTHFGHKRICEFCPDTRPFENVEEHDRALINNWNSVVGNGDHVYVLGDFFLGGYKNESRVEEILSQLVGKKTLIMGNHDLDKTPSKWFRLGFDNVLPMAVYKRCLLTHIPVDVGEIRGFSKRGRFIANIHGHLHEEGNTPELISTGRFCVSAEQINLTPIKWDDLWKDICYNGKRYIPLYDNPSRVIFTGEGRVQLAKYSDNGKRIHGELVDVSSNEVYDVVPNSYDNTGLLGICSAGVLLGYVRPKNFVGVRGNWPNKYNSNSVSM